MSFNPSHIKSLLLRVLEHRSTHRELTEFINLCHNMAVAYLRMKKTNGKFNAENVGLTIEDFAFDSIAELFKYSDAGFPELTTYFENFTPLESASADEIQNALRCLIFSNVNHRIYRSYREHDSSLGRIIRNIKEYLTEHSSLKIKDKSGEKYICSKECKTGFSPVTPELFSIQFWGRLPEQTSLNNMLSVIAEILSEQPEHQKIIPLVEVALLIRSVYSSKHTGTSCCEQSLFTQEELKLFINESLQQTKQFLHISYVQKGKLTRDDAAIFYQTISDILDHEFLTFEQDGLSYFSIMKSHSPTLTQELYNQHHRVIIEYVAKQAKNDLRERLKRELGFL
ncbi:MAG: hypothetical protein HY960_11920 [Ignavibacteriae bacterium]|nr:hypothetical protein [Ignavibacteriota bacterium]